MEKVLKLYKYIDGSNDTPFPNVEYQAVVSDFRYDVKRMGGAPIITCTVMHTLCLDKLWSENVYAYFNGERFFIKQIPTSSYNNTDSRYKHELELISERFVLDNVYFYDVVDSSENNDKPVSNSSNFSFFGDINEFASRLNQSLQYSNVDYSVVVDDGISSEAKMVSFQDQFFSGAIQECYNTYNVPFYFEGKVIHFGYTNNAITHTFKYGQDESLLSIQKQNANYKVVNRVTGVGSEDNIPYYYPNDYESKEEVEANGGTWINPQTNLMPSIYRESLGKERFYEALNNAYQIPGSDEYYEFENPYIEGKPKEHIVNFDYIKPTIKGITNSEGLRIDMFKEFAYDANDNDEVDEEGNYLHPYFFAKLRKFDGEHGFNLFDHAIDEQEMVISMTSGSCGACEFAIGVDETTQKNPVQVDDEGNLKRDEDGNVIVSGTPQDAQNNTQENEVWIALKKDIDTFGVVMPNASKNYRPSTNDTFVILHIDLPKAYILAAEDKLKEELIKYMSLNNSEKFNFSISFSRIFFAENPKILEQLNENARIQIEYDNTTYELYISSYSYSMSKDAPLPEIRVELSDTLTISQNALQTAISEIKSEIISSGGSGNVRPNDILKLGLKYFLRKDTDDRSKGKVASDKGFEVGKFVAGASGAIIQVDAKNGQTIAELDKLYVRMKAYFETLEIINVNSVGGKMILSPAGSVTCLGVEELEDSYRCYFLGEQDGEIIENRWQAGVQAYSQMFNAKEGVSNKVSNNYYWRLVTAVSEDVVDFNNQKCHYIDLSKSDCDTNSDIPKAGDVINHRGCRNNADYMNFIEFSAVGTNAPYITLFQGVNSYSLANKEYVSFGYDQSTGRAYMNVYGDMYFGNRDGSSYIKYNPTDGLEVKGKLSIGTTYNGSEIGSLFDKQQEDLEKLTEAVTKEFENIRNEMDGAIDTWFGEETPTLGNYPAVDWTTNADKDSHLGDLFYTNDGKAYRFQYTEADGYYWSAIEDSEVVKALELAQKALDTADGKRRVFIEQPYTPYDLGDLWAAGESQPLMRCINARESGSYYASDWAVADDSHAYTDAVKKDLQASINATKSELDKALEDAEAAAKDYTDEGNAVLQLAIDEMEKSKANLDDVYTKAFEDDTITKLEARALEAAQAEAKAAQTLAEEASAIYADGVVTKEEEARIEQAKVNLASAKQYAEEKANEAFNNAMEQIAGYEYLKEALKEDTSIEGGIIQSSLIKLGYTGASGYVVMAGSNGTLDSSLGDKSIAFWAGGDMLDRENGSNVSNAADFLVRMDGSGYAARGNLSWDINGKITADPMSFFVGEDTVSALLRAFTITYNSSNAPTLITPNAPFGVFNVNGAATFASTLSVNGDITAKSRLLLGDIPMYKSKDGVVYIDGNLVVKGGVTMYGTDATTSPSIFDSLPIASTSSKGIAQFNPSDFAVKDGVVSFVGSVDGGVAPSVAWSNITGKPTFATVATSGKYSDLSGTPSSLPASDVYSWAKSTTKPTYTWSEITSKPTWIDSSKPSYSYSEITGAISTTELQNYLTQNSYLNVTSGDNRYLKLSGGTLTDGLTISAGNLIVSGSDTVTNSLYPTKDNQYTLGNSSRYWSDIYTKLINGGTPWTSVNDGSGSGLDADLLDGLHNGELTALVLSKYSDTWNYSLGNPGLSVFSDWNNTQSLAGYFYGICIESVDNRYRTAIATPLWGNGLYWRRYSEGDWQEDWRCLLDSHNIGSYNAGSATQVMINYSYNQDINYPLVFTSRDNIGSAKNGSMYIDFSGRPTYNPKSDTLTVGNLSGNASSANVLAKSYKENINYSTYHSALKLIYNTENNDYGFPNLYVSGLSVIAGYTGWQLMSYGGDIENPYFRSLQDTGAWKPWRQIAFLTDNVASATKLQTARTIWGQSFDGSSNVDGDFTQTKGGSYGGPYGGQNFYIYNKVTSDVPERYGVLRWAFDDYAAFRRLDIISKDFDITNTIISFLHNGNVGIGTTNPSQKLHIVGNIWTSADIGAGAKIHAFGNLIANGRAGIGIENPTTKLHVLESSTHNAAKFETYAAQSVLTITKRDGISWALGVGIKDNGDSFGWWTTTGQRCAASIDVSGNFWVNGGITMYSDQRKKTILNHVELSLKQIANAPLIEHYYNSDEKKTTHVGSIAQYWAEMNDWFCKLDSEGYYTMEIQNAALASAISIARELDRYETKTDKAIKKLKKRICELEEEVERLKSA